MPKVIGVIQVKGGAGRSTVSTNLAGELSKQGKTVLIDCDMPQGTSASWYAVRHQAGKAGNLIADTATSYRELVSKVEQYADADYIVLDGPPRIAELTRSALVLAAILLMALAVSVGLKSWLKLITPLVAVAQSGTPAVLRISAPVQKTSDSGMTPVRTIFSFVAAVTVPASIGVPVAFVELYVEMRTKNGPSVSGLVTLSKRNFRLPFVGLAAVAL